MFYDIIQEINKLKNIRDELNSIDFDKIEESLNIENILLKLIKEKTNKNSIVDNIIKNYCSKCSNTGEIWDPEYDSYGGSFVPCTKCRLD